MTDFLKCAHFGIFLLLFIQSSLGDIVYVGCYNATATLYGGLDAILISGTRASSSTCGMICADAGFRFTGVLSSDKCACGDIIGMEGSSGVCDTDCAYGVPGEKCGGLNSASVYLTTQACFRTRDGQSLVKSIQNSPLKLETHGISVESNVAKTSDCQTKCSENARCIAYTYNVRKNCYMFTAPPSLVEEESKATSGFQIPCTDPYKDGVESPSIVGPAIGVALLSLLLISLHIEIRKRVDKK